MTAYEYLQKTAYGVAGGLTWALHVFTRSPRHTPEELIDTAVDIAWERLLGRKPHHQPLLIEQRGKRLIFRCVLPDSLSQTA